MHHSPLRKQLDTKYLNKWVNRVDLINQILCSTGYKHIFANYHQKFKKLIIFPGNK